MPGPLILKKMWTLIKDLIMKKENILVIALVVIGLGAVAIYNIQKTPQPAGAKAGPDAVAQAEAASASAAGQALSGIGWKDFTPGMAMARETDKSIFLYFHAPWCTYCTKLKKTTFKDEKVLAYLDKNFVSIQVDTDQNKALATQWNVTGLPTMWFLEASGDKINRMPGYVGGAQLLQILKYIHTKSYKTMEFREFVDQG